MEVGLVGRYAILEPSQLRLKRQDAFRVIDHTFRFANSSDQSFLNPAESAFGAGLPGGIPDSCPFVFDEFRQYRLQAPAPILTQEIFLRIRQKMQVAEAFHLRRPNTDHGLPRRQVLPDLQRV